MPNCDCPTATARRLKPKFKGAPCDHTPPYPLHRRAPRQKKLRRCLVCPTDAHRMSTVRSPGEPSTSTKAAANVLVKGLGDLLRAQLAGLLSVGKAEEWPFQPAWIDASTYVPSVCMYVSLAACLSCDREKLCFSVALWMQTVVIPSLPNFD